MNAHRNIENLKEKLSAFFLSSDFAIASIPGGASSRRYYKIHFSGKSYFPDSTVLLMTIPPEEPGVLTDYMSIDYYLKRAGIPTPKLFEINQPEGWIFIEHQELPTLENYFREHPETIGSVLPKVVDFLLDIQKKCIVEDHCPAFHRRFDYEKYMYEFNFHVQKQLLSLYYQRAYNAEIIQEIAHEISSALDISLPIFVHRDFQSSNIFYNPEDAERSFRIIDFQDARHGSPVYDLVSCLWDSYVSVSEKLRHALIEKYYQRLSELNVNWSWEEYEKIIDYTIIQRKLHDAGAFALNYRRFNSSKYLQYIEEAVEMALERLKRYDQFSEAAVIFAELLNKG